MQLIEFVCLLCVFIASVSGDCNRGFEEHDRPFVNVVTKQTVQLGEDIFPLWDNRIVSGGNLVVDKLDRTNIVVPANGIYAIVVILHDVSGSSVRVYRQSSFFRRAVIQQASLNSMGTTVCGCVSFLESNDRLTFGVEQGKLTASSSSSSSMQLFAYLISLSAG